MLADTEIIDPEAERKSMQSISPRISSHRRNIASAVKSL